MFTNEGITSFYRGLAAPFFAQTLCQALVFTGDAIALKSLQPSLKPHEVPTTSNAFFAGCFGGVVSCFVLVPTDNIKCRLQERNTSFNGVFDVIRKIYRVDGMSGLFRGMTVTTAREAPSYGSYFLTYKTLKSMFPSKNKSDEVTGTVIAGGCAGCVSWGCVYPIDVIKTHIQTSPVGAQSNNLTMTKVARQIYSTSGISGFFTGIGVVLIRAFAVNSFQFFFYEEFKKYI